MKTKLEPLHLPALKGRVGPWAFYTTLMKFSEIEERIQLSDEIYQNKNLSDMVQRTVRKSRTAEIAEYLLNDEERFFPAMVVAVFDGEPNWLELSINSGENQPDVDLSSLDISKLDAFGVLALTGKERLFPLDGQHRLSGIRDALKTPDATDKFLGDDEVAVMLVAHEPSKKGRTRSRRLFTVLNKRAVSVKKHETIALDEDDVMAVCTRYLVEQFEPLSNEKIVLFRTNASIPANNTTAFTTIVTVYDMLYDLFRMVSKNSPNELRYKRPSAAWMSTYVTCATSFFSEMMRTFPEVEQCLTSKDWQEVVKANRRADGGHVLFRPVGQRLLAQLVGEALRPSFTEKFGGESSAAVEIESAVEERMKLAFDQFGTLPTDLTGKPYQNAIWEPEAQKMRVGRATIVRDIILRRFGIIRPSVDRRLEGRIRTSIGPEYSAEDFLW